MQHEDNGQRAIRIASAPGKFRAIGRILNKVDIQVAFISKQLASRRLVPTSKMIF